MPTQIYNSDINQQYVTDTFNILANTELPYTTYFGSFNLSKLPNSPLYVTFRLGITTSGVLSMVSSYRIAQNVDSSGNYYSTYNNAVYKINPFDNSYSIYAQPDRSLSVGTNGAVYDNINGYYYEYGGNKTINRGTVSSGNITNFEVYAGTYGVAGSGGDGGPAISGTIGASQGCLALDYSGNLYICDNSNYKIRKVDFNTGILSTVVGTGANTNTGDGGLAINATTVNPANIAFDGYNNLYICHTSGVRKVDSATGIISTIAGSGAAGYTGDSGLAINAKTTPAYIAADQSGNVYICENTTNQYRIRKIDYSTGIIDTIIGASGTGVCSLTATPTSVSGQVLKNPNSVYVNNSGVIYVWNNTCTTLLASTGSLIWQVNPTGQYISYTNTDIPSLSTTQTPASRADFAKSIENENYSSTVRYYLDRSTNNILFYHNNLIGDGILSVSYYTNQ